MPRELIEPHGDKRMSGADKSCGNRGAMSRWDAVYWSLNLDLTWCQRPVPLVSKLYRLPKSPLPSPVLDCQA
jgi:hypothetical protein